MCTDLSDHLLDRMRSLELFRKIFIMAVLLSVLLSLFLWTNLGILSFDSEGFQKIVVKSKLCHTNFNDERLHLNNKTDLKMIYYVTPTYPRPEQMPELTRLAHTLMHVPRLHWIVADDQPTCSDLVLDLLKRTGLPFTLISSPKPHRHIRGDYSRGVPNRRAALSWLNNNVQEGVLYFGDDDNTYDLRLFDEIRNTKKVSMFPVGLIAGFGVSSPVVKDGKVVGFFDSWPGSRTFAVDMAGFAVNIEFLKPSVKMPFRAGYLEDSFLVSLGLKMEDIEPLADNCSRVLVWHTKSLKFKKPTLKFNVDKVNPKYTSFVNLLKETSNMHMASIDPDNGIKPFITRDRRTYDDLNEI